MKLARAMAAVALCFSVVVPPAAFARGAEEIHNVTIQLNTTASPSQVKKAVKLAVLNRRWKISNEQGGSFDASYTKPERRGDMTARIRVSYGPKTVKIAYLGSENMEAGNNRIHPYYNRWVGNLEKDIPLYVEREVVASE